MSKINIFETDFSQKYLITTSNNTTFYCGVIMKDILNHFNEKMLIQDIVNAVNIKYKTSYSEFEINQSIRNMQNNENITKLSFRPLLSLINSEKIPSLKLRFLTNKYLFSILFTILLFINLFFSSNIIVRKLNIYDNLMIYILLFAILILHEIGHSIFAKQYNIGTGKIGLGLYLFIIPVFYINLNEIWRLKNEKRIIINLGGIFFQLLAGIILVFIYQINQSDVLASLIKINLVIAMLNFNPFIKFDGYWALSDLLNNKDLYSQSNTAIKKWFNFKSHQYSKVITFYSIGRIIFYTFISYILINSIVIFLLSLWN